MHYDAKAGAALLQDLEGAAPPLRRKRGPAAGDPLPPVVPIDAVPAGELALHLLVDHWVGILDPAEGLVGEHHAEAEGVVGGVPLPDGDLRAGEQLTRERGEVQPAWPSASYRN